MKHVILCAASLLLSLITVAQSGPTIKFDARLHDFGDLKEDDGTATHTFTFTNTGKDPLVVQRAIASCGCTTPEFTKEPVLPGGTGTVKVTYNMKGRPDDFHKTITIYSNDKENPQVILSIKGNVLPGTENMEITYPMKMNGLRLNKTQVSILDARTGSIRSEKINVINSTTKPLKISFKRVPSHIRVVASNTLLNPKESAHITVTYLASEAHDYGRREDTFELAVNNDASSGNLIHVSAYITEDFSKLNDAQRQQAPEATFSVTRLNLGELAQRTKKSATITLTNTGKSPLIIRKIVPEYDGLKLTAEKTTIAAGKSIKLTATFDAGTFAGNVVQRVSLFTNDPNNSLTRLFVTAQVTPSK